MYSYESYMKRYPTVSKGRTEKLVEGSVCLFLKRDGTDYAVFPNGGYGAGTVWIDLRELSCQCNTYHNKKACAHVAAALYLVEKNGGKIPYTDPVKYVYKCLEHLKGFTYSYTSEECRWFYENIKLFLWELPESEKINFVLHLARYYDEPNSNLTGDVFLDCLRALNGYGSDIPRYAVSAIYRNRKECYRAVVSLMGLFFSNQFTDKEKDTVLKEIAVDDVLTARFLPSLVERFSKYFSREQIFEYYKSKKSSKRLGMDGKSILRRFLEEEPPLYDEFLYLYNMDSSTWYNEITVSQIGKMVEEELQDKMGKLLARYLLKMTAMEDYYALERIVPHNVLLEAWRNRKRFAQFPFGDIPRYMEIEINFRLDPDTKLENYNLDVMSCHLLGVILKIRPEYQREINSAVRKIYRKAVRENDQQKAMEAIIQLARGEDRIAAKYASEWKVSGEQLVYVAAVGVKYNSMQKLLPEFKKMEGIHASGQN